MIRARFGRRRLLTAGATVLFGARPTRAERRDRLYVQPLGRALPDDAVAMVQRALQAFYAVDVLLQSRIALPRNAYYPPRGRYRAEKLLEFLAPRLPRQGHRILGITGVDISTTKGRHHDWGILGLADIAGTACVLSSWRCHRGARDRRHAVERFGKVAVHEIGHTFGLPHCTATPGCLMEDAHGTVATVDLEFDLCARCRLSLQQRGVHLASGSPPWPAPP